MKISLIMATVDRCQEIHRFLDSLEKQTARELELIIVDQNKDNRIDSIMDRLSHSPFSCQHIRTEQRGLSFARNLGLKYAKHEVVGYPDDDCWYEPDVVERVLTTFENDLGIEGIVARWVEKDLTQHTHVLSNEQWRKYRLGISGFSSCLFFKKGLVEAIRGFDENLGVPLWFGAAEEIDFTMRCLNRGAKIVYRPDILIHHPVKTIYDGHIMEMMRRVRQRSRGTGALYCKHQLGWYVVGRGLVAPLVKSLGSPYSLRGWLASVMTVVGRCEGLAQWARK